MSRLLRSSSALLIGAALFGPAGCDGLFGEPTPDIANPSTFDQVGVRFDYPGNWKLSKEAETFENITMTTVNLESPGSVIAVVQQFQPGVPLNADELMTDYVAAMREELAQTLGGIVDMDEASVKDVSHDILGESRPGRRKKFSLKLLGEKVGQTCEIYPIELEHRSVMIYLQSPDEDLAKATPGFEQVLSTLTIEDN